MNNKHLSALVGKERVIPALREYALLTLGAVLLDLGVYFFKFPNNFIFGGVSGMAIILAKAGLFSSSTWNLLINLALLVVGFICVNNEFGLKTVYVTLLSSLLLNLLEIVCPMSAPLTDQPMLEVIFATVFPAVSSAILFNISASSGGTDIIAMILKKHTSLVIGRSLFLVDLTIVIAAFFAFDIRTGLFSFVGLMTKTLAIDGVIENINLCKYFTIVCDDEKPICEFIQKKLNRSATVFDARGSYTGQPRRVVLTVMRRSQAVALRNYIRQVEPGAFMMITNSSEIIGKGFRGLN